MSDDPHSLAHHLAQTEAVKAKLLSDLPFTPSIATLEDLTSTITDAWKIVPTSTIESRADFIARVLWPLIQAPVDLHTHTIKTVDKYPGIRKAALEIAYDNGMIHRNYSEARFLASLGVLLQSDGYYHAELQEISNWLYLLADEDLATLTCGEEQEQKIVADQADHDLPGFEFGADQLPASKAISGLLNDIFESCGQR